MAQGAVNEVFVNGTTEAHYFASESDAIAYVERHEAGIVRNIRTDRVIHTKEPRNRVSQEITDAILEIENR